jgi:hypothetical protein
MTRARPGERDLAQRRKGAEKKTTRQKTEERREKREERREERCKWNISSRDLGRALCRLHRPTWLPRSGVGAKADALRPGASSRDGRRYDEGPGSLVAKLQLRDPSAEALLPDALRRQCWRGACGHGASERNRARGSPMPEAALGKQRFPAGVAKQEHRDEETRPTGAPDSELPPTPGAAPLRTEREAGGIAVRCQGVLLATLGRNAEPTLALGHPITRAHAHLERLAVPAT